MKKLFVFASVYYSLLGFSQIPAGYYDGAFGNTGEALRTELHNIIKDHTELDYDDLWTHFKATDRKSNGRVWDIYSDIPSGTPTYEYLYGIDQCGQSTNEGDCFNREHTVPQSWFPSGIPAYTDLFQLYPVDGFVNNKRLNYPYGEVSNPTWTSDNGSKRGSNTYPGYSGTVFEPIDEYKGDIARTYFYMVTRYQSNLPNWSSSMFQDDGLTDWAENMMIEWANNDPVSQKEIDRNEAVYLLQGNRNPFIDHPFFIDHIWVWPTNIREREVNAVRIWHGNETLHIEGLEKGRSVTIYDLIGREVAKLVTMSSEKYSINLPSGVFIVKAEGIASRIWIP